MTEETDSRGGVRWIPLNSTTLTANNSRLRYLSTEEARSGLKKLVDMGLVFQMKDGDKKKLRYSVSPFNIMLLEMLQERYFQLLRPFEGGLADGMIADISYLNKTGELKKENFSSFFKDWLYKIPETYDDDYVTEIATAIYNNDIYCYDGAEKIISTEKLLTPQFINSLLIPTSKQFVSSAVSINEFSGGYYELVRDSVKKNKLVIGELYKECPKDVVVSTEKPEEDEKKVSQNELKERARNDFESYCEYMKIKSVLAKKVETWNATDFVIYMYCGMAKARAGEGNFTFPDFGKDCKQMSNLISRYGNFRLSNIIYFLSRKREEIMDRFGLDRLEIAMFTLNTDWLVAKVEEYYRWFYAEQKKQSEQAEKKEIKEVQAEKVETQSGSQEEPKSEQTVDDSLVNRLRAKVKGEKNVGEEERTAE
jgi:hypothetical protein